MAVETSIVPALINGLVDALLAAGADDANHALHGVQVMTAHPGKFLEPEAIFVEDVDGEQVAGAIGNRRREETIDLRIICWAQRDGHMDVDARAAVARAFAFVREVEVYLRNDPAVTTDTDPPIVVVSRFTQPSRYRLQQGLGIDGKRWASVEMNISSGQTLRS